MESYISDGAGQEVTPSAIYHLHGPWIFALILNIVQDSPLAGVLTMEVFWQAQRSTRASALTAEDARVWARVTARRLAIAALRTKEWIATHPPSYSDACSAAPVDLHEVWRALTASPRHEREAFELAYFEGLSHSEIAQLTGRSLGTVKTWVRTARIRVERSQSKRMAANRETAAKGDGQLSNTAAASI